mmetsp:Transcript_18115/g.27317  ORF Transcript_18115/g.27317 Transcript_18115/m.27317 type:complete len:208 (-) Transcript_18115:361-984(-)
MALAAWSIPMTRPTEDPSITLPRLPSLVHARGNLSKLLTNMSKPMSFPNSYQRDWEWSLSVCAAGVSRTLLRKLWASIPIMPTPVTNSMMHKKSCFKTFRMAIESSRTTIEADLHQLRRASPSLLKYSRTLMSTDRIPSAWANLWAKSSSGRQRFTATMPFGLWMRPTPPVPPATCRYPWMVDHSLSLTGADSMFLHSCKTACRFSS